MKRLIYFLRPPLFETKDMNYEQNYKWITMDAKDLMIGDWVLHDSKPKTVDVIWGKEVSLNDPTQVWGSIYTDKFNGDEIEPIPLTPEILEKNGFVKYNEVSDTPPYDKDEEGNMYYSYKGEQKFWGWWQPNNVYLIPVNAMIDLEIKYVHQLQHALRLCGIDKEIEI